MRILRWLRHSPHPKGASGLSLPLAETGQVHGNSRCHTPTNDCCISEACNELGKIWRKEIRPEPGVWGGLTEDAGFKWGLEGWMKITKWNLEGILEKKIQRQKCLGHVSHQWGSVPKTEAHRESTKGPRPEEGRPGRRRHVLCHGASSKLARLTILFVTFAIFEIMVWSVYYLLNTP